MTIKQDDLPFLFEQWGYAPTVGPMWSPGDRYFRFENSTEEVVHVACLAYQPKNRGYSIYLSAYSPAAIQVSLKFHAAICRNYRPVFDGRGRDYFDNPGWVLFNAGRLSQMETVLTFGNVGSNVDWRREVEKVRTDLLEPVFWNLREPSDVLELLFRNDYPFDWAASQVILRVALIAGIQVTCAMPAKQIADRIATHKDIIQRHNQFGKRFEEIMSDFF